MPHPGEWRDESLGTWKQAVGRIHPTLFKQKLMKIIDCTSFYNEHMMYEVRLNVLKDRVDKFIDKHTRLGVPTKKGSGVVAKIIRTLGRPNLMR